VVSSATIFSPRQASAQALQLWAQSKTRLDALGESLLVHATEVGGRGLQHRCGVTHDGLLHIVDNAIRIPGRPSGSHGWRGPFGGRRRQHNGNAAPAGRRRSGSGPAGPVDDAARLTSLLSLLADPVRSQILYARGTVDELCVGDLAPGLDASEDTVSYALRIPRTAGLVTGRHRGRTIFTGSPRTSPHPLRSTACAGWSGSRADDPFPGNG
jgi:DNA-binding transcriptional ArsR family regulator